MNQQDTQTINQQQALRENTVETASLTDLSLTNSQTEEVRAGAGGGGGGAGKATFQDMHFSVKC